MSASTYPLPTELSTTLSACITETPSGFEVTCPDCREVVFKSDNRRAVFLNTGKIGQHIEACSKAR
jgi:hypothetical protein